MYNLQAHALGDNRMLIRELAAYAEVRAAEIGAENVFDFSVGNPSIPTPVEVQQAMLDILQNNDSLQVHGYTAAPGAYAVRKAIAEDLNARFGADVTPEELFIGCGAAPELAAVFHALAVPDAEVLAIAPYFPEYDPYVTQAGAKFRVVSPDIPGFQIRLDAVEEMINPNTVAIIVNSPNNPCGTVYTRQTLTNLADLLKRKAEAYGHPIYIVSDEPYRELVYGDVEVPFIPNLYPDTIVCYSYSKSLSLAGERIGYVYVPRTATDGKALYAAVAGAFRAMGHVCAPSLLQKTIARCTGVRPDLKAYDENRKALYEGLLEAGYETAKPDGAFYLFVKAPGGDAREFSRRALKRDLLVGPGDDFGCPGYFRACYCVKHDTIVRSLPIFRQLIKEYEEEAR